MPISAGVYYFESLVISKGRDGFIGDREGCDGGKNMVFGGYFSSRPCNGYCAGIGLTTAQNPLSRLPGWEAHGYGYHGDDGILFRGMEENRLTSFFECTFFL